MGQAADSVAISLVMEGTEVMGWVWFISKARPSNLQRVHGLVELVVAEEKRRRLRGQKFGGPSLAS